MTFPSLDEPRRAQVGSIGVTRRDCSWTHNRGAWIIQTGTRSRWNHTAIVTRVNGSAVQVTEAAGKGVRQRWLTPGEDWVFDRIGWITPGQRQAMADEAAKYIGWPYDYGDIARFVLRFWGAKARGKSADHADSHLICSELVCWSMHVAGIEPWPTIAPGDISPGDIGDWMFREESR